ncbi:hypothetical protein [Erwinia sp. 9145]|uniref:hypothetical protein n=1 Tax=Erwinia sp. 9145 TaxID=1500895 RepID=UPI0005541FAA|nr:hypothetical protein [Erwinia sp. 9145]
MLLFQTAKDKSDKEEPISVLISPRSEVIDSVTTQFEMRGAGRLDKYQIGPDAFDTKMLSGEISYFIFDVQSAEECERFLDRIELLLSKETCCIAIGNIDSLLLASALQAKGIYYIFYHPDQMPKLGQILDRQTDRMQWNRSSLKISMLACKGGVGNSTLSYHLAKKLVQVRQHSLLLVQGAGGTRNLDLIARGDIASDVIKLQENLFALYEQREHRWDFTLPLYETYDFVLFDHTVHNAEVNEIEHALNHTHCVILVCNHDLASVRNAKKVVDYNQHLQNNGSGVKKIFVCFNEAQPRITGAITAQEAGSLIGQPVDIAIPWIKKNGDPASPLEFSGKNSGLIEQLTHLALGRRGNSPQAGSARSLFSLIRRKR